MTEFDKRLDEYKNQLENYLDQLPHKPKPNPHHYPIIDHWNYKYVWRPHRHDIFDMVDKALEDLIPLMDFHNSRDECKNHEDYVKKELERKYGSREKLRGDWYDIRFYDK